VLETTFRRLRQGGFLRQLTLARSPEEPQFGVALLKLVIELRQKPRGGLDEAMARALKGMRVDREAFRQYVYANRDRYVTAGSPVAARRFVRVT
jgi:hypothetical protein